MSSPLHKQNNFNFLRMAVGYFAVTSSPSAGEGEKDDGLNAVLSEVGYNIRWLWGMIAKRGLAFSHRLYLRLCEAAGIRPNWLRDLHAPALFSTVRPRARLQGA